MALRDQLRVLVVDDMSTSRGLITQALDSLGIRHVSVGTNVEEAIKHLETNQTHLVISDYNMPGQSGLALLERIRSQPNGSKIAFILITGKLERSVIEKGKALAMNNVISKPFNTDDVRKAIEAVLGRL